MKEKLNIIIHRNGNSTTFIGFTLIGIVCRISLFLFHGIIIQFRRHYYGFLIFGDEIFYAKLTDLFNDEWECVNV